MRKPYLLPFNSAIKTALASTLISERPGPYSKHLKVQYGNLKVASLTYESCNQAYLMIIQPCIVLPYYCRLLVICLVTGN